MKFVIFICLFLIFIINNNLLHAQELKIVDITNGGSSSYNKYPSVSDTQICQFTVTVHAYVTTGGQASIAIDQELPLLPGFYYSEMVKNESSLIAKVGFNNTYGTSVIKVRAYASGYTSYSVPITFTCEEIDTNSLIFNIHPNNQILKPMLNVQFYSILSIQGLKYPLLNLITPNSTLYSITTIGTNLYGISLLPTIITTTNTGDLHLTISFQTQIIQLILPTINRNSQNSNFNVKLYPNALSMTEFGINYSPIYTISSNSGSYIPFYEICKGNKSLTFRADPVAIYGTIGNYTYIGNYNHLFDSINMSIFTQNGNGLEFVSFLEWDITIKTPSQLPSTFNGISESGGAGIPSVFTPSFSNSLSDYSPLVFQIGSDYSCDIDFPFGYELINANGDSSYRVSFIKVNYSTPIQMNFSLFPKYGGSSTIGLTSSTTIIGPTSPSVLSFDFIYLNNFNYIIKIKVNYDSLRSSRIAHIKINGKLYRYEKCTSQDTTSTTFEIGVSLFNFIPPIEIMNRVGLKIYKNILDYYNLNTLSYISSPPILNDIDIFSFQNVSFLFNNLNVTDQRVANKMYFNFPAVHKLRPFALILLDKRSYNPGKSIDENEFYYSKWNQDKQLFEIEFFVPANIQHGVVPWMLTPGINNLNITNSFLPESNQLIVTNSNFDSYGPIFTQVAPLNIVNKVGWYLTIVDQSGFKSGEITVRGVLDGSIYTFHFSPNDLEQGDIKIGLYRIEIDLTDRCFTQRYAMTNIILLDIWDNKGTFSTVSEFIVNPVENVFINYMDNPSAHITIANCQASTLDLTPPTLVTFDFDYNSTTNVVLFTFQTQDLDSGIKEGQNPTIYATSSALEMVKCFPLITEFNSTTVSYNCVLYLPYGFGYDGDIIFSIYGLINNAGLVSGYSSQALMSKILPYYIQNIGLYNQLYIKKVGSITTNGGDLWVYGLGFDNVSSILINYNNGKIIYVLPKLKYSTALLISNILPTNEVFRITLSTSNSEISNTVAVYPIYFNYITPSIPTNAPQKCLGNPECGGSNKGYCSTSGCICYSPWIGNDCTSKIVIVPQPVKNTTNPSTQIPIPTNSNESGEPSTDNIFYNSLISIHSLREFDFKMNIVNEYIFDKWIFNEIDSTTSEYQANIIVPSTDGILSSTITNITAKLQWFKDETNITFANEQLQMNPSTIKYTIQLSDYSFKTNLNTLQLIISASFSTSKSNDICSIKEFGNTTTGDNSNYLKIQIQDHSLYGRFIKRAVVDGVIISINNTPLDESLNSINSASISQSYIGINLPNYQSSITIDPDFSVLLDSNTASNNDNNSICASSKSGLTTAQLVGIIVGSAVIFISIVGVAIFILIKKRKHTLLLLKLKDIKLNKKL